MKIILFPIVYLFELIKANIVKTIIITITSILFAYAGTIPDQTCERVILKEIKIGNEWVYLYQSNNDIEAYNQPKRETLIGKDKNILRWKEYAGGNVALWAGVIILVIVTIVTMCVDEGRWDFDEVFDETVKNFIKCEIEDNVYVYTIFGRLITKESYQTKRFSIYKIKDITILPKYKLRSEKREDKLNKLGI
jgi:hypothetical protein